MLSIILTIILSLLISFLVTLDASPVTMRFGDTTLTAVPLFLVVFYSLIVGAILASITTIVNLITSKLTIMGKNSDLKKSYKVSDKLQEKNIKLEEEKTNLKEQLKEAKPDRKLPFSFNFGQKDQK